MKILRLLTIVALLGGAAYAQAPTPAPKKAPPAEKAPPPPKTPPADTAKKAEVAPQDVEKFLVFFNKFVDVVVAAKEECPRLAKDITVLFDANAPLIAKMQEARNANKELPQSAKDKMNGRIKEIMPSMMKCNSDPNFAAQMQRLEGKAKASAPPTKATETPAKVEAPAKTETKAPAKTETKAPAPTTKK